MGLFYTKKDNSVNIKYPEKIFHEEKRAPTDHSIKLAKEYEEIIESKIIEKLIVQGNVVNFSIAFQQETLFHKMHIKMKINEKVFKESFNIINPCVDDLMEKVTNWMCEIIILDPIREIALAYASGQKNNYRFIGIKD